MNIELNRLKTFSNWPGNVPINPARIAKGGFYATGRNIEAQCYWCQKKISDWRYGDQVMARHRRLDPLCPFLTNQNTSGNVPITSNMPISGQSSGGNDDDGGSSIVLPDVASGGGENGSNSVSINSDVSLTSPQSQSLINPSSLQAEQQQLQVQPLTKTPTVDLLNEQSRLATFQNWPVTFICPQQLAKAGFYYYNQSDRVACAYCRGVIGKWELGDNPFTEHAKFFPNCPRVELGPNVEISTDEITNIGITQIRTPKREKYSSLDARIRTFTNWQHSETQKPETLATAGFYYLELDDHVRCFHCNGGLCSWQKEDDPWYEHAKWFPNCQFLELVKGCQYITEVRTQIVQPPTLDVAMSTEPVIKALQMGLNVGRIRSATKRHLELYSKPYQSVEMLVEAVLDGQSIEEDDGGGENSDADQHHQQQSSSVIVRDVCRILDNIFTNSNRQEINENINHVDEESAGASGVAATTVSSPSSSSAILPMESSDMTLVNLNNIPETLAASATTSQTKAIQSIVKNPMEIKDSTKQKIKIQQSTKQSTSAVVLVDENEDGGGVDEDSDISAAAAVVQSQSLEEENRKLKDARLCKVCMDEDVGVVFLPCGHLVTCVQCATGLSACPLCRTSIKAYVRTFLS